MSAQIDFIKAVQEWLGVDSDGDPREKTWNCLLYTSRCV